jgi:hypothetical protein
MRALTLEQNEIAKLAYYAGVIASKATFEYRRRSDHPRAFIARIRLVTIDEKLANDLVAQFGGSVRSRTHRRTFMGRTTKTVRPQPFLWELNGRYAARVGKLLRPFMLHIDPVFVKVCQWRPFIRANTGIKKSNGTH